MKKKTEEKRVAPYSGDDLSEGKVLVIDLGGKEREKLSVREERFRLHAIQQVLGNMRSLHINSVSIM